MKKLSIFLLSNLIFINFTFSQSGVSINTTGNPADNSAMLDVSATGRGLLIPRISTANRPANPVESLIIYNTDTQCFEAYNANTSQWISIACLGNSSSEGCPGFPTLTDIDGNVYNTVLIGTQCWMKENLKTTKYKNSTAIPNVTNDATWTALTTGAYCDYNNTPANSNIYGRLYNWYAVSNVNGICPNGWRVPSDADYVQMEESMGVCTGTAVGCSGAKGWNGINEGAKLKEDGTSHWKPANSCGGTCNSSGFTALPAGYRGWDNGSWWDINKVGVWWTSTSYDATFSWYRILAATNTNYVRNYLNYNYLVMGYKMNGYSLRCLKN